MNAKKTHGTRRVTSLAALCLLAALALATFIVAADDEEKKGPAIAAQDEQNELPAWTGRFFLGIGFADDDNVMQISGLSAGRAAEYRTSETTGLFGLEGFFDKGSTYAQINAMALNGDDFGFSVYGSADRQLIVDAKLSRFLHRLDNDLMTDWEPPFSVDPGSRDQEMQMRATLLQSKIRYKPSSIPSAVLYLHARLVAREGDRQARTFDHCFTCHATTRTQQLDQMTFDLAGGAEYARKPFAARYLHRYRSYSDDSSRETYDWENRLGNFELEGVLPFALTPENTSNSDIGEARYDIGDSVSLMGRARHSTTENDSTGYELETTYYSGRGSAYLNEWVTLRGRYDHWDTDNTTPLSAQRETTQFTGSVTVRPHKTLNVEGRYRYYKREREGGTELLESITKSFRLKGVWRPDRRWRLVASHEFIDNEDPFGRVLRNSFSRIDSVLLTPFGSDEDRTYLNLIYCPTEASTFDVVYTRDKESNNPQNAEYTFQSFSANATHQLREDATVYGGWSWFNNQYERTVYFGVLSPWLDMLPMPYEGTGNTLTLGAYLMLDRFSIGPSWSYTTVDSSIDDSAIGAGISERSAIDATVNRVGLTAGAPITDSLDANFGYWLDDYEDALRHLDDGRVQWFYAWLGWAF